MLKKAVWKTLEEWPPVVDVPCSQRVTNPLVGRGGLQIRREHSQLCGGLQIRREHSQCG